MSNPTLSAKPNLAATWLNHLDRILRGEATRPSGIEQADIKIPVLGIAAVVVVLALIYGFCMGIFALARGVEVGQYQQALLQTLASMCKVPLLFGLTLVVTFPSLYVFNALVGSQLKILPVLKLLLASLAVNLSVLASMGPILAFFSVSTPNYSFIVLLNVAVFAIAGLLGLAFLVQTLNRLTISEHDTRLADRSVDRKAISAKPNDQDHQDVIQAVAANTPPSHQASRDTERPGPLDRVNGIMLGKHVRTVFSVWIVVFGLVGAQMGWVLRPFIGSPQMEFQWFRPRSSNFFEAVGSTIYNLLF